MKTTIFLLVLNAVVAVQSFAEWEFITWINGFLIGMMVMDLARRIAKRFYTPEDAA